MKAIGYGMIVFMFTIFIVGAIFVNNGGGDDEDIEGTAKFTFIISIFMAVATILITW